MKAADNIGNMTAILSNGKLYYQQEYIDHQIATLTQERDALREVVKCMARVASGIPDNWPEQCVLTWQESHTSNYAYICYVHQDYETSGITIGEYRKALALLSPPAGVGNGKEVHR